MDDVSTKVFVFLVILGLAMTSTVPIGTGAFSITCKKDTDCQNMTVRLWLPCHTGELLCNYRPKIKYVKYCQCIDWGHKRVLPNHA
ncbi:hypothetical protein LINGRAHAP2_LOCUS8675 [Linum grandiflorum]